jgi:hypothetical protein
MLLTIDFNDQPWGETCKICDMSPDWDLSAKARPLEFEIVPERPAKLAFGIRDLPPRRFGTAANSEKIGCS